MHFKIELSTGTVLTSRNYDDSNPSEDRFVQEVMRMVMEGNEGTLRFRLKSGGMVAMNYKNATHVVVYGLK